MVSDADIATNEADTIRTAEAMRLLGVGRTWLWQKTKEGAVPSFRIGGPAGPLRYSRRELEALKYRPEATSHG